MAGPAVYLWRAAGQLLVGEGVVGRSVVVVVVVVVAQMSRSASALAGAIADDPSVAAVGGKTSPGRVRRAPSPAAARAAGPSAAPGELLQRRYQPQHEAVHQLRR